MRYDFNAPESIPAELHHTFDLAVIDPPFITREVWDKYATTARLVLRHDGHVIITTIAENREMIAELLGATPQVCASC